MLSLNFMKPIEALDLLEQAANKCDADARSRRLLFTAVDLLKAELNRLAGYDANRDSVVEAPKSP